tara:strand:- start:1802 stop:2014 length:213 start_codon:yes stop_codon:yes gene_type:complete
MNGMNIGKKRFWELLKAAILLEQDEIPPSLSIKITLREEEGTDTSFTILSHGLEFAEGIFSEATGSVEVW